MEAKPAKSPTRVRVCAARPAKRGKVPFFRAHTLAEFGRSRLTACENSGFSVPVGHFDGAALGQGKIGPRQQQQQGESVLVSVCVCACVCEQKKKWPRREEEEEEEEQQLEE